MCAMNARHTPRLAALGLAAASLLACERLDRYGTGSGSLEGAVETADLVRAGFAPGVRACLELDTGKLQSEPGFFSTSDGRFTKTPLRPIPPLASDSLSNLSFADGQVRNLLFAVREAGTTPRDALAVLSLLDDGRVELRVIDGAPGAAGVEPLYGIFALERKAARCSF